MIGRLRSLLQGEKRSVNLPSLTARKGRAAYSYLMEPLTWKDGDGRFEGHSNRWESREIALQMQRQGLELAALDWTDHLSLPSAPIDLIFDIDTNLIRLESAYPKARTLLHLTGSYGPFQNAAELQRIEDLYRRKGARLKPRRYIDNVEELKLSLDQADACSLIGNEFILKTFPKKYHPKISLTTVTASVNQPKSKSEFVPDSREFLWFFGGGALHKGLDLVLEVFAKNPQLTLNVVGGVAEEDDFFELYKKELTLTPNIKLHGYLNPAGSEFNIITARCFCFIAPSCSESISTAVATCLQIGLYPILTRETGATLPSGRGVYLKTPSIDEIELQVLATYAKSSHQLAEEIGDIQREALMRYSRANFSDVMGNYLKHQISLTGIKS